MRKRTANVKSTPVDVLGSFGKQMK